MNINQITRSLVMMLHQGATLEQEIFNINGNGQKIESIVYKDGKAYFKASSCNKCKKRV